MSYGENYVSWPFKWTMWDKNEETNGSYSAALLSSPELLFQAYALKKVFRPLAFHPLCRRAKDNDRFGCLLHRGWKDLGQRELHVHTWNIAYLRPSRQIVLRRAFRRQCKWLRKPVTRKRNRCFWVRKNRHRTPWGWNVRNLEISPEHNPRCWIDTNLYHPLFFAAKPYDTILPDRHLHATALRCHTSLWFGEAWYDPRDP